jgi:hypothetical protein
MPKLNKDIMDKIENSHDTILEWKPTMDRLHEIFKPQGKFDDMYTKVIKHDEQIKINAKSIGGLRNAVIGVVTAIVTLVIGFMLDHFINV